MDWTSDLRASLEPPPTGLLSSARGGSGPSPAPPRPLANAAIGDAVPATSIDFGDFYAEQWPGALRLAVGIVDQRERAEELTQDAFEKTLLKWGRLDNPVGYLRTCLVNGARSEIRRRQVMRRHQRSTSPLPDAAAPDTQLLDALRTLSARRRAALVMRFWLDLPDADIAEALGVRPATVRSLVFRGLDDLRKVVER